ncbi:MAG: hypothetical protein KDI46_03345 [Alphaproteobacteria bacterium]|nr:hypothetical protein [Alphaproteobacteria bacterium]
MADPLYKRLEDMRGAVEDAQAQIERGRLVDLPSLERDAAYLCDQVKRLEPARARDLQAELAELISALDDLALALERFRNAKQAEKQEG